SCRDRIDRIAALAGTRLDDGWARRLGDATGGARGCSHLLTLGHLLGSSAAWALARERALHGAAPARPAGQRVFRRDVVIDGHESAAAGLQLIAQTSDLHFTPAGALVRPMDRFAEQLEVRLVAEVEFPALTVGRLEAAERRRGAADLEGAAWRAHGRGQREPVAGRGVRAAGGRPPGSGAAHRRAFLRAPPRAFDSRGPGRAGGPPAPARKGCPSGTIRI